MRKYLLLFALLFGTSVYAQTIDFDGQGTCSAVASQGEAVSWSCTGEVSPPPPTEVQCVDGLDNDGDGLIDINDPGCSSPQDNDESDDNPPPPPPVLAQCEDGVDNDGDSLVDLADPGCSSSSDDDETDVVEPPPPPPPSGDWPVEVPVPFGDEGLGVCAEPQPWPSNPSKFMELSGSNCVSDGINIVGMSLRVTGNNVKVRDFIVNGNGQSFKVGLTVSGNNVVLERGQVSRMLGNDKHCYTLGQGASNVWIIDSEGFYCSGDGFQAGHQASANPPSNVYLVRNTFHDNRENGIDLKYMNNVIAAQNIVYNARSAPSDTQYCLPDMPDRCSIQNSGSDGTGIIIGSDGGPTGWAFYDNLVYDSDGCFRIEDSFSEGTIEGNQCDNITRSALQLDKESVGRIFFTNNTITNSGRGIFQNWRDNFALDVVGNLFQNISGPAIEYETRAVCEDSTLVGNTFSSTGSVICGNTSASTAAEINALPGASGNVVQ